MGEGKGGVHQGETKERNMAEPGEAATEAAVAAHPILPVEEKANQGTADDAEDIAKDYLAEEGLN